MRVNDAKGMMAFWTDIDDDYVLEFQKWHNCEHMIERTGIPGFLVGRRYRGIGEAPMFFISYETTDSGVFKSQPYMDRLNDPTPWTQEALTHFNNNMRNIYRLLAGHGAQAPSEAPYCLAVRFNIPPEVEAETLAWYTQEVMPAIQAIPGVFRARLFEVDEQISNIQTAERAIYDGGPGQQKYLAYYEVNSLDLVGGDQWKAVRQSGRNPEMFKNRRNVFEELSWLECVIYSPDRM